MDLLDLEKAPERAARASGAERADQGVAALVAEFDEPLPSLFVDAGWSHVAAAFTRKMSARR